VSYLIKSLYNHLEEPVIVYDIAKGAYHCNSAFSRVFGDESIKRIINKFDFEICLLESDEIKTYTPISAAISSKYDFCSYVLYQRGVRSFAHFVIKAVRVKNHKVIYFYDITKNMLLEKLEAENAQLKAENERFVSTSSAAQNQAVKMALLNRISSSILEAKDVKDLITTALQELSTLFAATKAYFISEAKIEYIYPETCAGQVGEEVSFDVATQDALRMGKIASSTVLKEHLGALEHLKSPLFRIVAPICAQGECMGSVVILTPKKEIVDVEREILLSICTQVASAIVKMNLQLQLINSEKMASLGHLVASVAHEINTPLASISANNEMRKKLSEADNWDDNEIREMAAEFDTTDAEAIKRISGLVQSLKRFVRLDEEVQQQANINAELDLTLTILRHKTKNGIEIIKNYGDIPPLNCYPNMLNQVFLNILMNSIQANACKITISTYLSDNNLCVSIADNGDGISDKDMQKICHAGFTTKKIGEGTGLGLAICEKIIEKHRGDLTFSSVGARTEFVVKIPV
jgi:K+-sensing histidine kinase KdpD